MRSSRSAILGWLLFDWACQPFFTLITTFVFAPFFASALAPDPVSGQSLWGYATAAAGFVLAILSPVLGSIADATGPKKPWIASCGLVLFIACFVLWRRPRTFGARPTGQPRKRASTASLNLPVSC